MRKSKLIREFSEFNLQRMSSDTVSPATHVDNPQLSIDAHDKHLDKIRTALSRIGDIHKSMSGTTAYRALKSKLSLEEQDVKTLKIIRITKNINFTYDVYISFVIGEMEYWGVVKDILHDPKVISEVFQDEDLVQTDIWVKRLEGFLIKAILSFLKPQSGFFKLVKESIVCYSSTDGKMMKLSEGTEIEVLKSYNDAIHFEYDSEQYTLKNDNLVYFNWWFEPIEDQY